MTIQPSGRPVQPTIHVIGGVTIDLIMGPVAPWPQPGTETFVAHSELRAGGPAGNTALALRALRRAPSRRSRNIGNDIFGQWLADAFGETAYGWQRVRARRRSRSASSIPAANARSSPPPATSPSRPSPTSSACCRPGPVPGDIALLTGAFLYPALLDSFDRILDIIAKRGFAVALDTGWPPDGWDSATRGRRPRRGLPIATTSCSTRSNGSRCRATDSIDAAARWMAGKAKPGAVLVVKRGADGASAWAGGEVCSCRRRRSSRWSTRPARATPSTPAISAPGWPARRSKRRSKTAWNWRRRRSPRRRASIGRRRAVNRKASPAESVRDREDKQWPCETTPRFDLDGKTVLVTGASRGIGRACALACAGSGAD